MANKKGNDATRRLIPVTIAEMRVAMVTITKPIAVGGAVNPLLTRHLERKQTIAESLGFYTEAITLTGLEIRLFLHGLLGGYLLRGGAGRECDA